MELITKNADASVGTWARVGLLASIISTASSEWLQELIVAALVVGIHVLMSGSLGTRYPFDLWSDLASFSLTLSGLSVFIGCSPDVVNANSPSAQRIRQFLAGINVLVLGSGAAMLTLAEISKITDLSASRLFYEQFVFCISVASFITSWGTRLIGAVSRRKFA
jgi:hypothetical protein